MKDAQGRPVAASLGVAVVDESLFARTADLPQQARAAFLLEHGMLATTRGISAADVLSSGDWTSEEQAAAGALFALTSSQEHMPSRQQQDTLQAKVQKLDQERFAFEGRARLASLLAGVALALAALGALLRVRMNVAGQVAAAAAAGAGCWLAFGEPWLTAAVVFGALLVAARQSGAGSGTYRALRWVGAAAVVLLAMVGAFFLLMQRKDLSRTWDDRAMAAPEPNPGSAAQSTVLRKDEKKKMPTGASGDEFDANFGALGAAGGAVMQKARPMSAPSAPAPMVNALKNGLKGRGFIGGLGGEAFESAAPPRRIARVREYFPETMFVRPELIADEHGMAELTIPVADSITAWRVSAFASSAAAEARLRAGAAQGVPGLLRGHGRAAGAERRATRWRSRWPSTTTSPRAQTVTAGGAARGVVRAGRQRRRPCRCSRPAGGGAAAADPRAPAGQAQAPLRADGTGRRTRWRASCW